MHKSLRENADLPSAASFAECQKSGTRRSHSLPSAGPGGTRQSLALGKEWICQVPQSARHSAKGGTRQKPSLPSATLDKEWHSAKKWHLTAEPAHAVKLKKKSLPSAGPGTRQRGPLPSAKALHSVKIPSLPSATSWHSAKDHMWRCLGFRHPTSQLARNLLTFLP